MTILLLLLAFTFTLSAPSVSAQTFRLADARSGPSASTPSSSLPTSNLQPRAAGIASGDARQYPTSSFQIPASISPTSPLYTDLLVNNLFHSFSCLAIGQSIIGAPCLTYQMTKNAQGMIQGVPVLSQVNTSGGALGATTSLIGMLYQNPPVRTADYLASIGEGMGIVKTANAQVVGSGAAVLSPILRLWQVSRNISYVLLILIFLVIGLMVMFRNKLNPQTVITAQAALPGLVIGLIMITFSFFFAGLISDMAFVGVNIVGYYFSAAGQPSTTPKLVQDITTENVVTIFSRFIGMVGSGDMSEALNSVFHSLDGGVMAWIRLFAGLMGYQAGQQFGAPIGALAGTIACASTVVGAPVSPLCGVIAGLVGSIAGGLALAIPAAASPGETFGLVLYFVALAILIYTMLKLLLKLVTTYLSIIFLTITAPFQFLFASLPGRQGIVTGWILSMLANILAFPAVFAVFYFAAYLLGPTFNAGQFFGTNGSQSLTSTATLPLLGGLNLRFLNLLVAFVALMATPTIPEIISRALGKFSQAGQLIGQEFGSGIRSGQSYAGQFGNRAGGIAGSTGKTLGGETNYMWDPNANGTGKGGWIPYAGSPGLLGPRGVGGSVIQAIRQRLP